MATGAKLIVILVAALLATCTFAASETELRERFKQRYPQLQQLKLEGKIGEVFTGYIDAVQPQYEAEAKVKGMIDNENRDRAELYQIMARQTGATPEAVAQRNATRNFEKARSGDYLKGPDGIWKRK